MPDGQCRPSGAATQAAGPGREAPGLESGARSEASALTVYDVAVPPEQRYAAGGASAWRLLRHHLHQSWEWAQTLVMHRRVAQEVLDTAQPHTAVRSAPALWRSSFCT